MLISFGASLWKQLRRSWVGWQSYGLPGSWCKCGYRICCSNYFQFTVKREERSRSKRCAFVERESPENLWTESWLGASEEREWLSNDWLKLRLKLRQEVGRREILTSLFKRPIKNLNLNDFRYIKQVDEQIKLREVKLACMENWNWEMGSVKRIMQEIANKLKIWEEFVAKKLTEQDRQELLNCRCIKSGTLRQWVNWWLTFRSQRTK